MSPNASQHVSGVTKCISTCVDQTNPLPRRRKMHLEMCWPNLSHASEDLKFKSTWVDHTFHIPSWIKHISTCFHYTIPMAARTRTNASDTKCIMKHVMTNFASDDTKFTSTCIDQNPHIPGRTQNISHNVLSCQCGQKIHLNTSWPNTSHAR